jgi:hypothetical protein
MLRQICWTFCAAFFFSSFAFAFKIESVRFFPDQVRIGEKVTATIIFKNSSPLRPGCLYQDCFAFIRSAKTGKDYRIGPDDYKCSFETDDNITFTVKIVENVTPYWQLGRYKLQTLSVWDTCNDTGGFDYEHFLPFDDEVTFTVSD